MIKEYCAENYTHLPLLNQKEIQRVELCDNLAQGGTTPSYGVIKAAADLLHEKGIQLATMVRPRGGDYCYSPDEIEIMCEDIKHAHYLKSDYLVVGALTKDNEIDQNAIKHFLKAEPKANLVFHMAFDLIPIDKQKASIDLLVDYGFKRILLNGSVDRHNVMDNLTHLKSLNDYSNGRIELMVGGGVNLTNYQEIINKTGVAAVHGTKLVNLN